MQRLHRILSIILLVLSNSRVLYAMNIAQKTKELEPEAVLTQVCAITEEYCGTGSSPSEPTESMYLEKSLSKDDLDQWTLTGESARDREKKVKALEATIEKLKIKAKKRKKAITRNGEQIETNKKELQKLAAQVALLQAANQQKEQDLAPGDLSIEPETRDISSSGVHDGDISDAATHGRDSSTPQKGLLGSLFNFGRS
jgi:chromosome segregation ATPase